MLRRFLYLFHRHLAIGLGLFALPLAGLALDGATIAQQGNGKGAVACLACHGADGAGQPAAGFPRLAHLDAKYLKHQLDSFADGSRASATMEGTAKALSDEERLAVANYYASLPLSATVTTSSDTSDNKLGEKLALKGKWELQVPACVQCHGPQGVGVGEHFPPLAGQSASYLATQLQEWKDGKRQNDPLGLMKHVAESLDSEEIQAVANWFAAQSAVLEE